MMCGITSFALVIHHCIRKSEPQNIDYSMIGSGFYGKDSNRPIVHTVLVI